MFYLKKFELIVPLFLSWLGSLILCTLIAMQHSQRTSAQAEPVTGADTEQIKYTEFYARDSQRLDIILDLYRQPESQERVIAFFAEICPSREIAEIILSNASDFDVSPALAFALSWEESRFNPRAVNRSNRDGSIDRGLFQLNNRSFPNMALQSFFNPGVNTYYAMGHLRFCLDAGGTEIAALAMYNAGSNRVRNNGTPMITLNYTARILDNRRKIEEGFLEREKQYQEQLALLAEQPDTARQGFRIAMHKPLGIR